MSNEEKIMLMLEGLNSKVEGIDSKVEGISNDLKEFSNTVADHGIVLEKLVDKVDKLKEGQAKLEEGQSKLEKDMTRLEQLTISAKEVVVLLENEQDKRIGTLYDANSRLYGMIKEALAEVSKVEPRLDFYNVDITRLLTEQADLKYKLNKLLRLHENELSIA